MVSPLPVFLPLAAFASSERRRGTKATGVGAAMLQLFNQYHQCVREVKRSPSGQASSPVRSPSARTPWSIVSAPRSARAHYALT